MRRTELDRTRAIGVRVTDLKRLHVLLLLNLLVGMANVTVLALLR